MVTKGQYIIQTEFLKQGKQEPKLYPTIDNYINS